jgi:hypothetical protein
MADAGCSGQPIRPKASSAVLIWTRPARNWPFLISVQQRSTATLGTELAAQALERPTGGCRGNLAVDLRWEPLRTGAGWLALGRAKLIWRSTLQRLLFWSDQQ